jgi:hypothetical protein
MRAEGLQRVVDYLISGTNHLARPRWMPCAMHGAVTIEHARIGLTPDSDTTYAYLNDLLTSSLTTDQ